MSNQFLCDLLALFLKQGFLVKLGKFLAVHSLRPVFVFIIILPLALVSYQRCANHKARITAY